MQCGIASNTIVDDKWLKPQETSLKSEKIIKEYGLTKEYRSMAKEPDKNRLKYLNTNNQQQSSTKKNVTWENNTETSDSEFEENIFKKLKKQQPEIAVGNINLNLEEFNNNESNEDKIKVLQTEIKTLHSKVDMIIKLLQK